MQNRLEAIRNWGQWHQWVLLQSCKLVGEGLTMPFCSLKHGSVLWSRLVAKTCRLKFAIFLPHSHRPDPLCGVMGRGSLCSFCIDYLVLAPIPLSALAKMLSVFDLKQLYLWDIHVIFSKRFDLNNNVTSLSQYWFAACALRVKRSPHRKRKCCYIFLHVSYTIECVLRHLEYCLYWHDARDQ